jgi:hypothetical protein
LTVLATDRQVSLEARAVPALSIGRKIDGASLDLCSCNERKAKRDGASG